VPVDTVPPEEVSDLRVDCFETRLVFKWTGPANAYGDFAGYAVTVNGAAEPDPPAADRVRFDITDLTPAAAYDFEIVTVDLDGNRSDGRAVTGITLLDNPADVDAQAFSGWVDLTWAAVQPAEYIKHFAVYVGTADYTSTEGMAPVKTVTATATSTTIDNLTLDVTYWFAVTTVNLSDGEQRNVTTTAATPILDETGPELTDMAVNGEPFLDGHFILRDSTVTLSAADYSGVDRVECYLDGARIHTDTAGQPVYTCPLTIENVFDGDHVFSIRAYDILDNLTMREFLVVINHPPPIDCFEVCVDEPR
jgi:hypothetical protein